MVAIRARLCAVTAHPWLPLRRAVHSVGTTAAPLVATQLQLYALEQMKCDQISPIPIYDKFGRLFKRIFKNCRFAQSGIDPRRGFICQTVQFPGSCVAADVARLAEAVLPGRQPQEWGQFCLRQQNEPAT